MAFQYKSNFEIPGVGSVYHLQDPDTGREQLLDPRDPSQAAIGERLKFQAAKMAQQPEPIPPPAPGPDMRLASNDGEFTPISAPELAGGGFQVPDIAPPPASPPEGEPRSPILTPEARARMSAQHQAFAPEQGQVQSYSQPQQPMMVLEPGRKSTTTSSSGTSRIGPRRTQETLDKQLAAMESVAKAQQAQLDVENKRQAAAVATNYNNALANEIELNNQMEEARRRQEFVETETRRRQQFVDQTLQQANQVVDPDRYWNKKSTFSKIGTAVSMAIDGYLSAVQGRPGGNVARMIQQAIRDDIAHQQDEINRASSRRGEARNQLNDFIRMYGSPEMAAQHLEMIGMQQAKALAEREAAERAYFDPQGVRAQQAQAEAAKLSADLDKIKADTMAAFDKENSVISNTTWNKQKVAEEDRLRPMTAKEMTSTDGALFGEDEEMARIQAMPSQQKAQLFKSEEKNIAQFARLQTAYRDFTSVINKIDGIIAEEAKKQGTSRPDLPGVGTIYALTPDFINKLWATERGRTLRGLIKGELERSINNVTGAVAEEEQKQNLREMGGIDSIFESDFYNGLENIKSLVSGSVENDQRGYSATVRALYRLNNPATRGALEPPKSNSMFEKASTLE